jgi:hypothetical protein
MSHRSNEHYFLKPLHYEQPFSSNVWLNVTYKPQKTDTHGSEQWPLPKADGNSLRIFERILTTIYGPIKANDTWRTRYNNLYTLYDELDIVQVIKTWRLKWLGHHFRMQEIDPYRGFTRLKPEGTRCECPTVASMKFTFFWDVMPCRSVDIYQHFRGIPRFHFYSRKEILRHKISKSLLHMVSPKDRYPYI